MKEEAKKETNVTVHKEEVTLVIFVRFKRKVNTLMRIKGKIRSFVPSLLIKFSQVLSL